MPGLPTLRRRLLAWYDAGRRDLPWRRPEHAAHPYRVWVAEVMLQQTRAEVAAPYFVRFVERFPTLEALSRAREDEVLALWSGLGYYARARNLHRGARLALERHGGLPASLEALRALPGFGPYTAGAVASMAFGIAAPAVDGNAARVLARLFLVEGDPASAAVRERIAALARSLLDPRRPGDLNQALIELGATLCGRRPACGGCPAAASCAARRAGRTLQIPPPRKRPLRREAAVACALVLRGGRLLLVRRPSGGLLGGLWDLPSADGRTGEGATALRRALGARFGRGVRVGRSVATVRRELTHRVLTLSAHRCTVPSRLAGESRDEGVRWARPGELPALALSSATRALLAAAGIAPERALTPGRAPV